MIKLNLKYGDKVKLKNDLEDTYGIGREFVNNLENKILTIESCESDGEGNWYRLYESPLSFNRNENMFEELELAKTQEEAYVKNDVEQTKDLVIQKLEIELKNKQSRIDYLKGQVSVYKEFLKL